MNNEIYISGNAFGQAQRVLASLNRKITNINHALNNQSYDEILQSVKKEHNTIAPSEMSLDDYKQYIVEQIQSMHVNPTHLLDNETVVISDKSYEAMQSDPEYEAWVLDSIRNLLSSTDYRVGLTPKLEHFSVHSFGASKEEYRGQSWSRQKKSPLETTEDYWTIRRKRTKKLLEMEQEMFDNVRQLKELSNRKAQIRAEQAKAAGLDDSMRPDPVIVGIPAEFLLGMLDVSNVKL